MTNIAIVGGGIGGLCTTIGLQNAGYEPQVYEAATAFRPVGAGIAIAPNGMDALASLGVAEEIARAGHPLTAGSFQTHDGTVLRRVDFERLLVNRDIERLGTVLHRATLHKRLRRHIPSEHLHLGKECVDVDPLQPEIVFADGTSVSPNLVIGADGIDSTVRTRIEAGVRPRLAGELSFRGVCELDLPRDVDPMGERWGSGDRFGWASLGDDRLYWFATVPARAIDDADSVGVSDLASRFDRFGEFAVACITATDEKNLVRTPLKDLPSLDRWSRDLTVLLGDAAHAMTPNLGQGASQAIEDAVSLSTMIDAHGCNRHALTEYESVRKGRTEELIRSSRMQGRIARLRHPVLRFARNGLLRSIPDTVVRRAFRRQMTAKFE